MSGKSLLPDPSETAELSPASVAEWVLLPVEQRPRLIDCREREEVDLCRIEGSEWIPLGSFQTSVDALKNGSEKGIVVYCHHGMRSMRAALFLRANGVENAFSMEGGIDAWSRFIDPRMPRY